MMQPADVALMKLISNNHTDVINETQRKGNSVTMKDVFQLFGMAWQRSCKIETAVSGFQSTGIVPSKRNIFKKSDFVSLRRGSETEGEAIPRVKEYLNVTDTIQRKSDSLILSTPLALLAKK